MTVLSFSVTLKVNVSFKSEAITQSPILLTTLLTTIPPSSLVFVNFASDSTVLIVPVSPVLVVIKPDSAASVTVYVIPVGRSNTSTDSPPFSLKSATPFVNVTSPYVPLSVLSLNSIVKLNSTSASAAASDTTVLLTFRFPVS